MTDNTQELDELVENIFEGELSWVNDQLSGTSLFDDELRNVEEKKDEAKQAILDWHNKQVEKATDSVEAMVSTM